MQTCSACPSQWEGTDIFGNEVYIRYRWGYLTIQVANSSEDSVYSTNPVYESEKGDGLDGVLSTSDLAEFVNANTELVKFI